MRKLIKTNNKIMKPSKENINPKMQEIINYFLNTFSLILAYLCYSLIK